ncbi:MAG: hypothetical protein ABUK01_13070 [Leptospirales bacterium]
MTPLEHKTVIVEEYAEPINITPEQLYYETTRVKVEFTRFPNIVRRAWVNRRQPLLYLLVNTAFYSIHKSAMKYWMERFPGKTY